MRRGQLKAPPLLWLVPSRREGKPPPAPADDRDLIAALRAGDSSVANAFHHRVIGSVRRTIGRLLGPGDPEAPDLAQQIEIELVYAVQRYRGDCSLDSWVSTVAAHVVYKYLRRKKLERRVFQQLDLHDDPPASGPAPAGRIIARQLLRRVLALLDDMGEARAWPFLLHDACGYDLRETSQILGISPSAAQSRLVRGRREIQERIACEPELLRLAQEWEALR